MRLTRSLASLTSLTSLASHASLALVASCAGLSFAQESFVVGPRALGMGGTGVAAGFPGGDPSGLLVRRPPR